MNVSHLFQVQTGFGRTGDHYWGFQGHDVIPDIGKKEWRGAFYNLHITSPCAVLNRDFVRYRP
jgi:hypothetical protein